MSDEGMSRDLDPNDPAMMLADRVIGACKREFADDEQVPRFVVVIECPPDGRIGIASTGDDEIDTHRILAVGAAAVRSGMTKATKTTARAMWDTLRAGFNAR